MILVIAEKPSVAQSIAKVLGATSRKDGYMEGGNYIVSWCFGHLVELADASSYDERYAKWRYDDLPIVPENWMFEVTKDKAQQFKVLSALMKDKRVTELVCATDAGREGELIFRLVYNKAGCTKPFKRLWISSLEDSAIREGFNHLRDGKEYDRLYEAALSRSKADWIVGINGTRLFTTLYHKKLVVGRVQTPTLAMLVERDGKISTFQKEKYFNVHVGKGDLTADLEKVKTEEEAKRIAAACEKKQAVVSSLKQETKTVNPPKLYDLTTLQREANRYYGFTAQQTLDLVQTLYEKKLLTYPRTDSRYISDDVVPTLPDRLRAVMTGDYKPFAQELMRRRPLSTRYLVNNAKVTDHHAIIPTEEAPDLWQLSGPERNIYDLVVRRFLAVLMPPCAYEEVELTLRAGDHDFTAKGRIVSEPGWRRVYDRSFRLEDEEEDEPQTLPALEQRQRLSILGASVAVGKTPPPPRYTEATLLTAMEHPQAQVTDKALQKILAETSGLGTPATRADIIEKLFSTFYIERRGKELVPTSKGMQLVELAPEDLRSAALTAQWEDRLARIAKGQERDAKFVEEMRAYASRLVAAVKASDAKYTHDNQTRKTCPDCGKFLLLVKGKRGEMLVCPDRECGYRKSVTQVTNARCPNCFKKMELRGEGENQMFACVCGYREKLSAFQERRKSAGAGKRDVAKYLQQQKDDKPVNSGMADALAKWLEKNQK